VLNRNTRPQPRNTILIEGDRHNLGEQLKEYKFDTVIDVTAYTGEDIISLCNALGDFENYMMISSSAVYPETNLQPFKEEQSLGENKFWGKYGIDKIEAEKELLKRVPEAKTLREGLRESYEWYRNHTDKVNKKPYMEYIDEKFK